MLLLFNFDFHLSNNIVSGLPSLAKADCFPGIAVMPSVLLCLPFCNVLLDFKKYVYAEIVKSGGEKLEFGACYAIVLKEMG